MSQGHRWGQPISRHCPWSYCRVCGLVALKNRVSQRAAGRDCPGETRVRVQILSADEIRQLKQLDKLIWE